MTLNESHVEDAALGWFGELDYSVGHGPKLAPGEPGAERDSFGAVVLVGRLREAIWRLNPFRLSDPFATLRYWLMTSLPGGRSGASTYIFA
jgi:hypothetical protein